MAALALARTVSTEAATFSTSAARSTPATMTEPPYTGAHSGCVSTAGTGTASGAVRERRRRRFRKWGPTSPGSSSRFPAPSVSTLGSAEALHVDSVAASSTPMTASPCRPESAESRIASGKHSANPDATKQADQVLSTIVIKLKIKYLIYHPDGKTKRARAPASNGCMEYRSPPPPGCKPERCLPPPRRQSGPNGYSIGGFESRTNRWRPSPPSCCSG